MKKINFLILLLFFLLPVNGEEKEGEELVHLKLVESASAFVSRDYKGKEILEKKVLPPGTEVWAVLIDESHNEKKYKVVRFYGKCENRIEGLVVLVVKQKPLPQISPPPQPQIQTPPPPPPPVQQQQQQVIITFPTPTFTLAPAPPVLLTPPAAPHITITPPSPHIIEKKPLVDFGIDSLLSGVASFLFTKFLITEKKKREDGMVAVAGMVLIPRVLFPQKDSNLLGELVSISLGILTAAILTEGGDDAKNIKPPTVVTK